MEVDEQDKAIIISGETYKLYGILRDVKNCEKLVLFAPWVNGDRTGLTRIYVEAAREFHKIGISSLCIDLPPNGYSFDRNYNDARYIENYSANLERTLSYLKTNFQFKEYTIIGFCSSAIPAIYLSRKYNFKKVICLNPYDFMEEGNSLTPHAHEVFHDYFKYYGNKLEIFYLLSEKEQDASRKKEYLEKHFEDDNCTIIIEILMSISHTFDGWYTKRKVIDTLANWIR